MQIVGEGRVRAQEDVILDPKPVPQIDPVLQRDAIPDDDVILHEAMRADIAVAANPRARQHHDKLPDAGPGADVVALQVGEWMNEDGIGHIRNFRSLLKFTKVIENHAFSGRIRELKEN